MLKYMPSGNHKLLVYTIVGTITRSLVGCWEQKLRVTANVIVYMQQECMSESYDNQVYETAGFPLLHEILIR
jgi:hypothetical protein